MKLSQIPATPEAIPAAAPAVVLLSGGLDSATVLALARDRGYRCHALTFRYGQRHHAELSAADRVATDLGAVEHVVIDIDLRRFGQSALTSELTVPHHDRVEDLPESIPVTYVPARNTIFLSFALAWAETLDADDIFIGVNALDYSGYPDCRPEYMTAFEAMANLATKSAVEGRQRVRVHAPLIGLTKAQIIQKGLALGIDYAITHSCYDPAWDGTPCQTCDACLIRAKGFSVAGCADPVLIR